MRNEFDYAVEILKRNYERALSLEYVWSPLLWALYKTWRYFDSKAKKQKGESDCA